MKNNEIDPKTPVIVGVADIIERVKDPKQGRHPLQLLEAAIRAADADADAGGGLLQKIDSIDIAHEMSWPYVDLPGQLLAALSLPETARCVHGPVGGESPLRYLQDAARRVTDGQSVAGVVCGVEALNTVMKAAAAGITLDWPARDPDYRFIRPEEMSPPESLKYGLRSPVDIYPLYENATRARWGQSFLQAQTESAEIWSTFSEIASGHPAAWLGKPFSMESIRDVSADNRSIAWPYSKFMVANNSVNQAGAVIVTRYATAREAGIADDRLVFIWDGCAASEPRSILDRDNYFRSTAQDTVLEQTLRRNQLHAADIDFLELYSCFPCVPKMARRSLGLELDQGPFSVTGGLTFFGAPLNSYMTHAIAAMTRALRGGQQQTGLLYGQGEFVTKHHAIVISNSPPPQEISAGEYDIQSLADAARGPVPQLLDGHVGEGRVETFTVFFDRAGKPRNGVVIAQVGDGARCVARIPKAADDTLARFTEGAWEPIGSSGRTVNADDGLIDWQMA